MEREGQVRDDDRRVVTLVEVLAAVRHGITATRAEAERTRQHVDRTIRPLGATMSQIQNDIAAAVVAINNAVTELAALEQAIADLKAANPAVDTSALDTAVAGLNTALASAAADNPAPPPTDAPPAEPAAPPATA